MKEKTLLKNLAPTIAMLVVAILALSGVTFAWFTTANAASIGTMDLNVQAAEGLLISTSPDSGWKSTIDWSEITNANGTTTQSGQANIQLKPVSTVGSLDSSGHINFYKAELANDTKLITNLSAAGNESAGGYLSFNLYIWNSGSSSKSINLGSTSVVAKTDGTQNFAEDAIRIGFVTQSSKDMGTQAGGFTANTTGSAVIFEPNATAHTTTGKADYKALNGQAAEDAKFEYYGIVAEDDAEHKTNTYNRLSASAGKLAQVTTHDASDTYVTLPANKVTKVTVYVWLEGQDADCFNDIGGSDLSISLNLAGPTQ